MTAAPELVPPKEHPLLFSGEMVRRLLDGSKTMTRRIVPRPTVKPSKALPLRIETGCDACWNDAVPHNGEEAEKGFGGPCYLSVPACDHVGPRGYPGGGRIWPKWNVGDRIWCKETFQINHVEYVRGRLPKTRPFDDVAQGTPAEILYRADGDYSDQFEAIDSPEMAIWRPSIFMPHWASRLTLEVTAVRVEKLNQITEEDARAEGVPSFFERFPSIGRDQSLTSGELCADSPYRASLAVLWDELNSDRATWKSNPWVNVIGFRRVKP
jgi:hypothetical protein